VITAHENCVSLEQGVWVKIPSLLEEFRQALPVLKLQSNAVVLETELLGKTTDGIVDLSVL
jgi:hypothetical protein